MSKLMTILFATVGLGIASASVAQTSQDNYTTAKSAADAQYKIDKDACSSQSGNANDICVARATGKANVAKAAAEAKYENTPKTRESSRVAIAQASYDVASAKCDGLAGNRKDVCVKEAKAALVKGKADAMVDRVAAVTQGDAAAKQGDARREASADKLDADYKVAIEKCDALAGAAKETCERNAKTQSGKY
jgi:hypothetical protein